MAGCDYIEGTDTLKMAQTDQTDVVIVTALSKENAALLRHVGTAERVQQKHRVYYRAELAHGAGGKYRIVVLSLPAMGNVDAAITTSEAISIWNPSHIILTGIAGGVSKADRFLGDVVVAEQIVGYELGRVMETGTQRRYQTLRPAHSLIQAAKNLRPEQWVLTTKALRPDGTTGRVIPQVHFGVVASGDKVVASQEFTEELRSSWSQLAAVDMEGYGTALATYRADTAPGMLFIKAICDWSDRQKNDDWQDYAADVAAAFTVALLKSAPFESKVRPQAAKTTPVRFTGKSKLALCRRLTGGECKDLADYFEVPEYQSRQFDRGRECQGVWEWLEVRQKLDGLRAALKAIDRDDLLLILEESSGHDAPT